MLMRWLAAIGFLGSMGLSCSEQESQTSAPVAPPRLTNPPAAAAPPVTVPNRFEKKVNQYFYNPVGKRDPFKPYVPDLIGSSVLPRSPLERYALNELALTGIVWGIPDPRALIKAPDGYSYIVRSNMRIGTNRGKISRITRQQVFIEEEFRDPTGKLVVRESSFEMKKTTGDTGRETTKLTVSEE